MAGTNGNGGMTGLSPERIAELMAGRARNVYKPKLTQFVESDEAGVDPREVWPLEFKDKKASALYQGFRGVATEAGILVSEENPEGPILVKRQGDEVFILHIERVAAQATAAA